jgi:hypothetical protein
MEIAMKKAAMAILKAVFPVEDDADDEEPRYATNVVIANRRAFCEYLEQRFCCCLSCGVP